MVKMFKTWWKARKVMKRPKLRFEFNTESSFRGYPGNWLLSWECEDVGWKDKYGTPRFETSPYFTIYLFGFFQIWIELDISDDFSESEYWEQLLWMLFYIGRESSRTLTDNDWEEAKKTWPWTSVGPDGVKKSTWADEYHL